MEKKNKLALKEEIVKYIFGTDSEIALGEDGYVVYNFANSYPPKLGIFIPSKVDRSNYSAVFPKSFESYFSDMYEEAAYLSRLLEVDIVPNIRNIGVKCVLGKVLKRDENKHTIFRFDELIDPRTKTDLLCRVDIKALSIDDKIDILSTDPIFKAEATGIDGTQYLYWIMPISCLFKINDEVLAAVFAFANSLRKK